MKEGERRGGSEVRGVKENWGEGEKMRGWGEGGGSGTGNVREKRGVKQERME